MYLNQLFNAWNLIITLFHAACIHHQNSNAVLLKTNAESSLHVCFTEEGQVSNRVDWL